MPKTWTGLFLVGMLALVSQMALAHDTWVLTNTNLVRTGDSVHVDLMLGNHGNDHRDFKLASKINPDDSQLQLLMPDGKSFDLKSRMNDMGYAPNEGFWTVKFVTARPGLYTVVHTRDTLHKTTRSHRSDKTFFVASNSLDNVPKDTSGFEKPLGHTLEIVLDKHPVTPMGPGEAISFKVLYEGQPLPNTKVSFIPRGAVLAEGFDPEYERMTDAEGRVSYTPSEGNYILAIVKVREPEQKGTGYDRTSYTASLTVLVPDLCPCCDE